jgi:ribosome-associated translation inhibitor RaiA
MTYAPDIRFIGMEACGSLAALAHDRATQLGRVHAGILSCRIAIEQERRRLDEKGRYRVHVGLVTATGHHLAQASGGSDDVYAALHDAFDGSRLKLERSARRTH